MCHYCGCRHVSLIRDYIAEHERVTDLAGDAVRAVDAGDLDTARRCIPVMAELLASHWKGEENGIFTILRREAEFADHITPLVQEHRELAQLLAAVDLGDPGDQELFRRAVVELHEHIAKEEDGLFPASLTALSGSDWDEAMAAWYDAHPGEQMMTD